MKNIFIIVLVIIAIGYMFIMIKNKYETIQKTNQKIAQQKKIG